MVSMIRKLLLPALHLYSGFKDTFFLPFLALYSFENMPFHHPRVARARGARSLVSHLAPGERRWVGRSHSSLHLRTGEGHASCQVTSDRTWARIPRFCLCFTILLFLFNFSGLEFHSKFSGETNHFRLLGGGVGGDTNPENYVY